jgi:6-phosphogluconolactonase
VLFPACAKQQTASEFYLFVGTYTSESSEGIYVYKFDTETGEARQVSTAAGVKNPSYLAASPNQKYLYAVNEIGNPGEASVSAFSFNKDNGSLTFLNKQPSGGGAPCYVSVDATGQAVFVGNYSGGSLAMLPVKEDGSLGAPQTAIQHRGSSVNEARQESPHVHCTYVSPDNKRLFVADLGTDTVTGYAFDEDEVMLDSTATSMFKAAPGAGPRHLTFHPDGTFAYLVNELNGTVDAFRYEDKALNHIQNISTLPEGYKGSVAAADIHVSPDGNFLYASNREDLNNIVIYEIDQKEGTLTNVGQHTSGGVHPRNFMIDPTGRYLLVANRNTDNIVVFKRNQETGLLSETGKEIEVSMPVYLKMIPLK